MSALAAAATARPQVAVLEMELDPDGPAGLIRRFREHPNVRLLLYREPTTRKPSSRRSARAFARSSRRTPHGRAARRHPSIGSRPRWTPPRLEARLASEENEARAWASLTPRERDVAGLVASGLPYKKVAEQLSISDHTVKNHLRRIYDKLDINSRVELALHAAADRP
ncbi:MAG: LuxR C-terminal-related transcriptional regulator [Bryobacterales bacterium]